MKAALLERVQRVSAYGAALAFAAAGVVIAMPSQSVATASADGFTATKTVHRTTWRTNSSTGELVESPQQDFDVTVTVNHTQNLRGRQRVSLSWSGAKPSAARAGNPYGENGLDQEYPVVILQCRGRDDASLPLGQRLSPETCWTSTFYQRSQVKTSLNEAIWTKDPTPGTDLGLQTGATPYPSADKCPTATNEDSSTTPATITYATHLTPFRAADGTIYPACDAQHMPPEASANAAFPPAELAAFTGLDGTGRVDFEVRSDIENESLGCNHKTDCSIVVIPIMGTSCQVPPGSPDLADSACKRAGQYPPGSTNFAKQGVDFAVSPRLWWAASNWENRISIPITFGLPPDACDILDSRPPTGFYGTELLAQASLQWSPAYCLSKARFKFQHNQMSDAAGWALATNGGAPAALVSSEHDAGVDPMAYAPTAVTGFGIGYVVDKPLTDAQGNPLDGGQYDDLKLSPRLIAKLLTQSYPASSTGAGHPGIDDNPWALNADPEFIALNPGLGKNPSEAAATLLSLSESSDVMEQLTDYLAHDQAAMDFIAGRPDPWGMVVNPAYKKIALPTPEWPLLDSYVPATPNDPCRKANPITYLTAVAAPVTRLKAISQAMIDAWPNVQTRCELDISTNPPTYKLGRIDRQNYGSRFMLGLVSLGDAARYGIQTAALQTKSGNYIEPTFASMGKAVGLMTQTKPLAPFLLDQADVKRTGDAYPGTMIVYTAARTQHLPQADADKVAQFIRVSTTEGQQTGSGNGELPEGFLPIEKTGVTRKLFTAAESAAKAIRAQYLPPSPTPSPSPSASPSSTPVPPPAVVPELPSAAPAPTVPPVTSAGPAPVTNVAAPVVMTSGVTSDAGKWLLPLLLALGIVGGLAATGSRLLLAWRR